MDARFSLLLACFFVSGFAALLYQTAWTRELSFVFGTSELAVVAVLAAYMGGLALGAAAAARITWRLQRPVLIYGTLELAIAVCALLVPWWIRAVNAVYVGTLGGATALPESASIGATLFQLVGAAAVLLPPTALMGATLPLLARHAVQRDDEIASRVGHLYAVNTAGAIAGTVCAAFWLMPVLGLRHTVWFGAALNALVFGLAALLARRAPLAPVSERARRLAAEPGSVWILPAIAISGMVSFAYEVMWTRLLAPLFGSSVQAFATMLASFLLGIALGSAVAARLAATRERATLGFALSQLGIALTSYAAFTLSDWLPTLAVRLGAGLESPLANVAVAAAGLLPVTFCIGMTFPFAVRVLAQDSERAAAATARIYSWNTAGAIVGALGAGFVLLPQRGFEGLLDVGVATSLGLAAVAALAASPRRLALAGIAAAAGVALALVPSRTPWRLLTAPLGPDVDAGQIAFSAVGRTSTVMLVDRGLRFQLLTDGLPESYIDPVGSLPDVNVAHWLSALPVLVRPDSREMLVVGLGGGLALELLPHSVETIDVIEIEPKVVEANRSIAAQRARDPLADPRVRIFIGDARGSLQRTSRRYDAIVSQPSHPWTAGASHLYTREFFSLVRSRLEPDGVFVQWIGLTIVDEALLRSLLSALVEVFPHVELFQPQLHGLLFVASAAPIDTLAGAARALQAAPTDFTRLGLDRLEDFASAWALNEEGVRALAYGAAPNTDDRNALAARSGRLGKKELDSESVRALLKNHDPLTQAAGLDRVALIRALSNRRMGTRATDLALAADGAVEEAGLGWVELAGRRIVRAGRHFDRALSLSPGDRNAVAGLIASRQTDLVSGRDVPGLSDGDVDSRYAAVIAGLRLAQSRDWEAFARYDAELASIPAGDALFELATRLRIHWLLARGDAESGARALSLADTLLVRRPYPDDTLLRAQAAITAGRLQEARASLRLAATQAASTAGGQALGLRVLKIARELPEADLRAIEAYLVRQDAKALRASVGGAAANAEVIGQPALPETPQ